MSSDSTLFFILGIAILIVLALLIIFMSIWWFWRDGRETFISFFEENYGDDADDDSSIQESYISEASSVGYEVEMQSDRRGGRSSGRRSEKPSGILRNNSMEPDRRRGRAVGRD